MGNTQTGAYENEKDDIHNSKDHKKDKRRKSHKSHKDPHATQDEEALKLKKKKPPVLHFITDLKDPIVPGQDYQIDESSSCNSDLSHSYSFSDKFDV